MIADLVDWTLDLSALVVAVWCAHYYHSDDGLRATFVETISYLVIIACIYGSHEYWEMRAGTHVAVEQFIVDRIRTLLGAVS